MSLSSRGVLLGIFTGLLAIFGLWLEGGQLLAIAVAGFCAWLGALAFERWQAQTLNLGVELELGQQLRLGVAIVARLHWHNPTARMLTVEWLDSPPAALTLVSQPSQRVQIAPAGDYCAEVSLVAVELGKHSWAQPAHRVSGPFGLALWNRPAGKTHEFIVLPDTLSSLNSVLASTRDGRRTQSRSGQGAEILELRDYRPSDPLSAIDWKATARRDSLIVRETVEEQQLEIMVAIDAGRSSAMASGTLTLLGHYVNLTARLAELAVLRGDRIGLLVFSDHTLLRLPPMRGATAVARIRAALATLTTEASVSNPLGAALEINRMLRQRSLVVMASDFDDADSAGQQVNAVRLLARKHLPLLASVRNVDIDALAVREANHWQAPYVALAAQDAIADQAASLRQLARMGATVVHARPSELDVEVLNSYSRLRANRTI